MKQERREEHGASGLGLSDSPHNDFDRSYADRPVAGDGNGSRSARPMMEVMFADVDVQRIRAQAVAGRPDEKKNEKGVTQKEQKSGA